MSDYSFVIVTGMSGAGKSATLNFFEDIGYFCVDNLPPTLIEKFAEICFSSGSEISKIALGIDIRGGKLFEDLFLYLDELNKKDYEFEILFLDCANDVLLKRYKETRRTHPLSKNESVLVGVEKEREIVQSVKERATYVIDTSYLLTRELKSKLVDIFVDKKEFKSIVIRVVSFGFKYGVPLDADLVFDVRFLPNPFYIPELRPHTGNDAEVQDFVMENEVAVEFLDKLVDMVTFLIPNYIIEGKNSLVIAIGCTGGKHRSVTLANKLFDILEKENNYSTFCKHMHIEKG